MPNPPQPPPGQMVLYDDILTPLEDNTYRVTVETDVTVDGAPPNTADPTNPLSKQSFFTIQGPRFQLAQTEVAGVFPPRNGHGSFSENVPHIVLYRRTLPWERPLDPAGKFPPHVTNPGDAVPPALPRPWLALLVFEDGDNFKIVQNMPLQQIVGPQIYQDLGSPPNVNCDALVTDLFTLDSVLPTVEELSLLTHVRQVNVNDRELNIGSTDGFLAVVMSNRLPSPNSNCTACLVSVEARSDLYSNPSLGAHAAAEESRFAPQEAFSFSAPVNFRSPVLIGGVGRIGYINPIVYTIQSVQLVLLQSWKFSATGVGSFRDLMQELNVAMIGTVANPGHPPLTDSGHLPVDLQDRAGEPEKVFYRGPLTPFQLTRDPLGPYHSADQCVRATPETGGKDISYAAAFEVGRLIAASDKTLASALAQWRRDAYSQSSRADTIGRAQTALGIPPVDLHNPTLPFLSAGAARLAAQGAGPIADPFGLDKVQTVVGFDPAAVQQAFNLQTMQEAITILGGDAGATGAAVLPIVQTTRIATTIDQVAADAGALGRLTQARTQGLANAAVLVGLPVVNSISPNSGLIAGGTTVTVTGSGFTGVSAVNFGPAAGSNVTLVSDTELTVVNPSQDVAGQSTVDIRVFTAAGASAVTPADRFTYVSPPTVTQISPNSGPLAGGTKVTVTGSGFTGASAVNFGKVPGTGLAVSSNTQLTVSSPPVTTGGPTTVDVTVVPPSGGTSATSSADQFTYAQPPTVTGISPNSGPLGGGTKVTVTGSGFTGASAVSFGTVAGTGLTVVSNTQLIVVSPPVTAAAQTTVDIRVVTPSGGTSTTSPADQFTYVPPPAVTGISPNSGPLGGGTTVTVTGSGFQFVVNLGGGIGIANASAVNFGPAAGSNLKVLSNTELTVVSPPSSTGGPATVDVRVVTSFGGTSATSSADQFTYVQPPPAVTGINPTFGPVGGGTPVTVTGTGFASATGVNFGSFAAEKFEPRSDQALIAVSPPGKSGSQVDITVINPGGTSATASTDKFTYLGQPVVIGMLPSSGKSSGGFMVFIGGTGLSLVNSVTFGTAPAKVINSSAVEITVVAPPGEGVVEVIVTNPLGATGTGRFTYTAPAPVVTGVNPTVGFAGQTVVISGSGFSAGVSAVNFGPIVVTSPAVVSDSQINVTVPQGSGTVDVTVTTSGGTSAVNPSDKFSFEVLE